MERIQTKFNEEMIRECKEVFELFDSDKSGYIDCEELENVLKSLG